jgi:hypothetical protein
MRHVSYACIALTLGFLVGACSGGSSGTGGDPDVPSGEDLTRGDVVFPPEDTAPEDAPVSDVPGPDTAGPDAVEPDTMEPDTVEPGPVAGHAGTAMVAGSVIASSPSYRLISTLGEPHGAPASPNYRLQTGVIGATQP